MSLVDKIDDELSGSKEYAECYIVNKAKGSMDKANKYRMMAEQELEHSQIIHDMALDEIDELERVFKPTEEMKKVWAESHTKYVEKTAWIKQMLSM